MNTAERNHLSNLMSDAIERAFKARKIMEEGAAVAKKFRRGRILALPHKGEAWEAAILRVATQ